MNAIVWKLLWRRRFTMFIIFHRRLIIHVNPALCEADAHRGGVSFHSMIVTHKLQTKTATLTHDQISARVSKLPRPTTCWRLRSFVFTSWHLQKVDLCKVQWGETSVVIWSFSVRSDVTAAANMKNLKVDLFKVLTSSLFLFELKKHTKKTVRKRKTRMILKYQTLNIRQCQFKPPQSPDNLQNVPQSFAAARDQTESSGGGRFLSELSSNCKELLYQRDVFFFCTKMKPKYRLNI